MKTTSSHVLKGMVIGIILLVVAQAWRAGRDSDDVGTPANDSTAAVPAAPAAPPPLPPSPRYQLVIPSEGSIEFTQQLQPPRDPWKYRTDPDDVWRDQRQRASEMLVRFGLPPLKP